MFLRHLLSAVRRIGNQFLPFAVHDKIKYFERHLTQQIWHILRRASRRVDFAGRFCFRGYELKSSPMKKLSPCFALLLFTLAVANTGAAAAQPSFTLLHSLFNPSTSAQSGVRQGYGLAVDGNLAVIGAPLEDSDVLDTGSAIVYDLATGTPLHVLTNPAPGFNEQFGFSVGLSGTRVVVGAPNDNTGATGAGVAYVYDLAGAAPTTPILILTNPAPALNERFGWSVALSGTHVVVGMNPDNDVTGDNCAVYVYDLASATPASPILTLTDGSPAFESFGEAVAISGTRVVVGSVYGWPGPSFGQGVAYVFDLSSATPSIPSVTLTNPGSFGGSRFGDAVAISGTRVVVGANGNDSSGALPGKAHVYDVAGATPSVPIATLTHPSPVGSGNFGTAVAIDGARVVVGALNWTGSQTYVGIAYVYDLAGATPQNPVATLNNPFPANEDLFGAAVGVSGTRVVIAARGDDTRATDAGTSYVYDFASPTPTVPVSILDATRPATGEQFGTALAVSGSRVVVGMPREKGNLFEVGRAYIYDLAGPTPNEPALTLTNPSPAANDLFGWSVALSGTRVLIGAYADDTGALNAGSAYLYNLAGATPAVPVLTLTNPSPVASDFFGSAVALSGATAVIGAYLDDTGGTDFGSVYVYDLAGATPAVPMLTLTNPAASSYDYFGLAVALDGTRVVIGAMGAEHGASSAGAAYVYDLAGAVPGVPILTLTNPFAASYRAFGWSVSISGERLVVGAAGNHNEATVTAKAYVYDLTSATPALPVLTLTNPGALLNDSFGYSVAISGTRVVAGAHDDDLDAPGAGRVYVFDVAGPTPSRPIATLGKSSPYRADRFGFAVAIDGPTIVTGTPGDNTGALDRGAAYVFGVGPQLAIAPSAPGLATLSWTPVDFPGFMLQYNESLASTNWLNAPSGAMNPVTIATTNAARFYRVAQP